MQNRLYRRTAGFRGISMVICGDAEEQFRLLFEAAPNGMIVTDHGGIITFVNRQTEKLFGYSRGELIGRSVEVLVPERFQGAHPSLRARFARQPETRAMGVGRDLYGLRKNKTEFPVEIGLNPFRSGDRLLVVASVVDITEGSDTKGTSASSWTNCRTAPRTCCRSCSPLRTRQ